MSSWFERFVEPSMEITPETNPVMMMRRNQRLYPVPEKFKTSGQYYNHFLEGLTGAVRAAPLCAVRPIMERKREFHSFLGNIRYAAACVIQKYYLRYKRHCKLRTIYFNTACHNDVNYYSVPATSRVDPVVMMRLNQRLYPVPDEFKTSGQYYVYTYDELANDFDEACFESGRQAKKAEDRFRAFCHVSGNIRYAAACIIRKYYLRFKMKRKLRNWNHFKAVPHNGVNYSSVLYLLLKQRWENYQKDVTDSVLNYTCERVFEKIHRQRACILIQRNFRRYSAQLHYEALLWVQDLKEQQRKLREEEEEQEYWEGEYYVCGCSDCSLCCEEEDDDWIEMEAQRDAQLEEDMERMREEYFY